MRFRKGFNLVRSRFLNVIFWSVISAAFIGPGTVTTASNAGAVYGYDLIWTFTFSIFACIMLQEAAARIAIYSGMNLGQAISKQFEGRSTSTFILLLVIGAIIVGCAAYQTGNILGSVTGLDLIKEEVFADKDTFFLRHFQVFMVIGTCFLAFLSLSMPSLRGIARFMGFLVMLMGISFFFTAIQLKPPVLELLKASVVPTIPPGINSGILILGLIGTTVVPYDLFLGSGVADKSQGLKEMRFGLSVAIILGGIISMSILVVGTKIHIPEGAKFSYTMLTNALSGEIGRWSVYLFGFGMFIAGFSSAITAPLASALTAQSLFRTRNKEKWETGSIYFKSVWMGVLLVGLILGVSNIEPIPAIILAQALNGLILPFISIFVLFIVNDKELMGEKGVNGLISNILLGVIVWVTLILGLTNVFTALNDAVGIVREYGFFSSRIIILITLVISLWIMVRIYITRFKKNKGVKFKKEDVSALEAEITDDVKHLEANEKHED